MNKVYKLLFIPLVLLLAGAAFNIDYTPVSEHIFAKKITGWGYVEQNSSGGTRVRIQSFHAEKPELRNPPAYIYSDSGRYSSRVSETGIANGVTFFIIPVPYQAHMNPGDFVKVEIELDKKKYFAVPESSVVDNAGTLNVIKKEPSGNFTFIPVEVTGHDGDLTGLAAKNLKKGDTVVTKGAYEILHRNIKQEIKIAD